MGANAATKLYKVMDNLEHILAIELMNAAQGIDFQMCIRDSLTPAQTETALRNALRYIPVELHEQLAPELTDELLTRGKIYGYRFRPEGDLKAKPIDEYKGNCIEGKAFQVMIDNNLSFDIALYPYELVTYGETGQVCQNWMQYRLIKQYLEIMTNEQTLVVESGHPLGLFQSHPEAPRVIITNSMMVGMFDNQKDWEIAAQMGVCLLYTSRCV